MNYTAEQINKGTKEQLTWLNSFKPLLELSKNYDKELAGVLQDHIEREAFKKGYLDVAILLDANSDSI